MRSPGSQGAKAKMTALRTTQPTSEPMTNVHTSKPASAQHSITGNVTADGVTREQRDVLSESRMRGALGEAGMSLPVQVWPVQSLASRTGASPAGVTVTGRPKRG